MNRIFGYRSLEKSACEKVLVCGAEEEPMRPAIHLPDEISNVTGVHEFSAGIEDEIILATRSHVSHGETLAYRFRDLCLTGGQLCNLRSLKKLSFERTPVRIEALEEVPHCAALCSTDAGNDYFAHFLLDDLSTAMFASEFGTVTFGGARKPRTPHMREYREIFDIPDNEVCDVWFRDAWVFRDFSQNSHRRQRLLSMRHRIHSRFHSPETENGPAYIRRGTSGRQRMLTNEAAIEKQLIAEGFSIVDPETMSVEEICTLLNGSPLVVGVEGSQLAHAALSLSNNGVLLCIQPSARFNSVYRGFTNSLGLQWSFTIAEGERNQFKQSPQRLLATIDLAMKRY